VIIGNGMLAKRFEEYSGLDNIIIFASGVSDSRETKAESFGREKKLLLETLSNYPERDFVYFSTCSIFDPEAADTPYVKHKLAMEQLIASMTKSYYIFRVSQIIGKADNTTLINYIINMIRNHKPFKVWRRANRNLIGLDDVFAIVDYIIKNKILKNQIINIASPNNISIIDLINLIEKVLNLKAICTVIDKGEAYSKINVDQISAIVQKLDIKFDSEDYYVNCIKNMLDF
jgi:nucleoside-diphosphate-sugar epimerase